MWNDVDCSACHQYTCKKDYDECVDKPCLNGGTCINLKGNFSCICPRTFKGQRCQEVSGCFSNPCLNGGTCSDRNNDYACACTVQYFGKQCQACQGQAVGVADRNIILDNMMTASSSYSASYYPWYARLNQYLGAGGWTSSSKPPPGTEYLQVDMGTLHSVCSVATQGILRHYEWTTSYKLHFSSDVVTWNTYKENNAEKVFPGNTDRNSIVKNSLGNAVTARYVRFYYVTYHSWPAIRVEIYVVN